MPKIETAQGIPIDTELWRLENFQIFLEYRRAALAQIVNDFLDGVVQEGGRRASDIAGLVSDGEGPTVEFKPTFETSQTEKLLTASSRGSVMHSSLASTQRAATLWQYRFRLYAGSRSAALMSSVLPILSSWSARTSPNSSTYGRKEPRRYRSSAPGQRVLGGDRGGAGVFQVGDELAEQLLGPGELVAEGAPDRQVAGQCLAQRAHAAPPGQGRASARSASVSALA